MSVVAGLRRRVNLTGLLVVAAAFGVWQALVASGAIDLQYVPAPSEVADGFAEIADAGELWPTIGHTLGVTLVATVLAMAIGIALGSALGRSRLLRTWSMGTVDVLRSLPVVALMPVALLIWGPVGTTEIILATYAAVWPMTVNVAGAVGATHPRLLDVAAVFRLSPLARFRKVILPAALPGIVVGARLTAVYAFIVAIVSEMIVNPAGIGWALVEMQQAIQPARLWAWMIVAAVLGYLLNGLLMALSRIVPGSAVLLPETGR